MTTAYKTRKKRFTREQRRALCDAKDALSPTLVEILEKHEALEKLKKD